jgi:hypothetical protein
VAVPLARDTSADVEERQIEAWRAMSPAEKAEVVARLTSFCHELALAGVRARYPGRSGREHLLRLATVTLGRDLALEAYPEIAGLDEP